MKTRLFLLPVTALFLLAAVIIGCSTNECDGNKNSLPLAGFYDSADPLMAVALDSTQIIGAHVPGGESALSGYSSGATQVYLPFRVDSDTTQYYLFYRQKKLEALGLSDTITFIYDRVPWFISAACGVIYRYDMKKITTTHTFIDSVVCPNGFIDNAEIENLQIYFRVSHDDEGPEDEIPDEDVNGTVE